MKKQLLSTSALVAAGLVGITAGSVGMSSQAQAQTAPAAAPITLSLGGFMRQAVYFSNQDAVLGLVSPASQTGKPAKIGEQSDTEIYFQGKTTLANGIALSLRVELEGNTSSDMIDESWMTIDGTFGTVHLGSTDPAAAKMYFGAPSAWGGAAFGSSTFNGINPTNGFPSGGIGTGPSNALGYGGSEDANLISYFTPRIEGFQLGMSYIPSQRQDTNTALDAGEGYAKGRSVSVNYADTIGTVAISASAGWHAWSKPESVSSFNTTTLKNPEGYAVGFNLGYAGFKFGGGYGKLKDQIALTVAGAGATAAIGVATALAGDGYAQDVGLTYTFGPTSVGVWASQSRTAGATSNSAANKQEIIALQGSYTLGAGVNFSAALATGKYKGEQAILVNGQDVDDNNWTGIATSLSLSF